MLRLWVWCEVKKERLVSRLRGTLSDDSGATVAEYALVLVLISVAVITVLTDLGTALQNKITAIVTRIQGTP